MSGYNHYGSSSVSTPMDEDEREWYGISDPKERRRVQNRIAQRNYREKQRRRLAELENRLAETNVRISNPILEPSNFSREYAEHLLQDPQSGDNSWSASPSFPIASTMERSYSPSPRPNPVIPVSSWLDATRPVQNSEQFLALHMLKLSNAIEIHLRHLNISKEQLANPRSWSPFVIYRDAYGNCHGQGNEIEQLVNSIRVSMPGLTPIDLQKSVPHHPYIDLIPYPGLRRTLLEILREHPNSIKQVELCYDIESGGLRLWGQYSWLPDSYELTVEFAAKWGFLFRRDPEALTATNFWRRQRGEAPLRHEHFGSTHGHGYRGGFRDLKLVGLLRDDL